MIETTYVLTIVKVKEGKLSAFEETRKLLAQKKVGSEGLVFLKYFQSFSSFTKKQTKNVYIELA